MILCQIPFRSMRINILMPVYRTPVEWVRQAVESILNQNHNDFSLIIVDDNNEDGQLTDYLYATAKQNRLINIIRKPSNEGIAAALNYGLSITDGDLIVRMDADDIANPDLLLFHDKYFTSYPYRHICGVQIILFNESRQWLSNHPLEVTRKVARSMSGFWFVNHPGIAFRRSTIRKVNGYNPTPAHLAEDYSLWVKFLLNDYTIYNMPEVLMSYRVHPRSFSCQDRKGPEWYKFLYEQKTLLCD